jgi:hypothetical protein
MARIALKFFWSPVCAYYQLWRGRVYAPTARCACACGPGMLPRQFLRQWNFGGHRKGDEDASIDQSALQLLTGFQGLLGK